MSKTEWPIDLVTRERVPRWATDWVCPTCNRPATNTRCTPEWCKTPLPKQPWRWTESAGRDGLPRWMLEGADSEMLIYADESDPGLGAMGWAASGVVVNDPRVRSLVVHALTMRWLLREYVNADREVETWERGWRGAVISLLEGIEKAAP